MTSPTFFEAMAAPIGRYPLVRAFATVMMSGLMSQCSTANILPVRPNPLITSSAMRITPYLSQISRTVGQYSGWGMCTPEAAETGSPMKAATESGPSSRIACSRSLAYCMSQSPGMLR